MTLVHVTECDTHRCSGTMTSDPNTHYDPLPLTSEDQPTTTLYNVPPSPDLHPPAFHTPEIHATDIGGADSTIPSGAATPRFLGAAINDDHQPRPRGSFPSSYHTGISQPPSDYDSSVYPLNEPNAHFQGEYSDDPRGSYYSTVQDAMPMSPVGQSRILEEKRATYAEISATKSRRKTIILAILAALILLVIAIVVPLYFAVIRPRAQTDSGSAVTESSKPTSTAKPSTPQSRIVTGGDGSEITMEDGTKFTYKNPFGGYWYYDEEDPFNNGARAQSWSPALNETFNYGTDVIRGCVQHPAYIVVTF